MMTGLRDLYAPNMPISSTPYLLTVGSVLLMLLLSLGRSSFFYCRSEWGGVGIDIVTYTAPVEE